jgi:hypothetical protein
LHKITIKYVLSYLCKYLKEADKDIHLRINVLELSVSYGNYEDIIDLEELKLQNRIDSNEFIDREEEKK